MFQILPTKTSLERFLNEKRIINIQFFSSLFFQIDNSTALFKLHFNRRLNHWRRPWSRWKRISTDCPRHKQYHNNWSKWYVNKLLNHPPPPISATHIHISNTYASNILYYSMAVYQSSSDIASPLEIKTSYGENNATYIIDLKKVDKVKNVTLQIHLKFISRLTDTLQGFYRVSYEDTDKREKTWVSLNTTNI